MPSASLSRETLQLEGSEHARVAETLLKFSQRVLARRR
eukprot:CAMPEP_0177234552 /NCGR_PEP_ID=MMETSP0367-20130122/44454_1 /TAXON_ID=447022 ORGANISM="Scrippsiella hangoei-like, Strain SHHI-4" /NCGR_SAMPLE_ID=MMETSP0367 /ASSEMBLY_ACC=CAM_ASM_000362 /LENGTH=37 /DNA_ID= /DNA_START= /DNA_END= /DNA_ORIENTATION=